MRLLLFSRDSCGSCKKWNPTIHKIADELNMPIEVFGDKENMNKYDVRGLPTTILLDDSGNEVYSILGNVNEDKALESLRYYIDGRRD